MGISFEKAADMALEARLCLHVVGSQMLLSIDKEETKKIGGAVVVVAATPAQKTAGFELIPLNETVWDLEIKIKSTEDGCKSEAIYSHKIKGKKVWEYRTLWRILTIWSS